MIGQDVDQQKLERSSISQSISVNPFPGLRPFTFQESYLYFGQDNITDQAILKLLANKFVCLLGGAGVGKTSLINCGIKPLVYSGLLSGPETTWHIFHTQPGKDPLQNLAHVFYSSKFNEVFEENQKIQEQICLSIIKRGSLGLVELINQLNLSGDHKFLFIIDQFEDLFKINADEHDQAYRDVVLEYVNLFVEALRSEKIQFYLVLSVRSDFADDFLMFPSLAEYINRSSIIIPKMSRKQISEAVQGPLRVFQIPFDDTLLTQILNDCATKDDMLPRLQHALQQTWKSWFSLNNRKKPISIKEYEDCGGMKNSISNHADQLYNELDEPQKKTCEIMFKALTERGSENKGFSHPVTIAEIAEIARTGQAEIIQIVNKFIQPGSVFLTIDSNEVDPSSLIDLSQVSLMRTWNRLKEWVEEEAISAQTYRQLSAAAASYQTGKTSLLMPPDLQLALSWMEKQNPTIHWAKRYHPAFERTMVFIKTSVERYQTEEAFKQKRAKKTMRRVRSFSVVLGGTALIAVGLTFYSQILKQKAEQTRLLAIEQKYEADAKSNKAERLSKEALEEKWRAELEASKAQKLRELTLQQNKELVVQKSAAETTAEQALRKNAETQKTLDQISAQKEQIEKKHISEVNTLKSQADNEQAQTFKKRMLAISQSLAIKSQQISGNKNLKATLALYAYSFNDLYGQRDFNPDIYNALNQALGEMNQSVKTALHGHSGAVKSIISSPGGNLLFSTGADGNVYAWNGTERKPNPRLLFRNTSGNLCLATNGKMLAIGSDNGLIQIIDLANSSAPPIKLRGHQGPVLNMVYSKDGILFSSGADKTVMMWNPSSGTGTSILSQPVNIRALSLSSDGKFLACGSDDGRIFIWQPKSDQLLSIASDDGIPIYSIAFNNNGTWLVTGDIKGDIKIWNPSTRKLIAHLKNHNARVMDIAFSPGGDLMATSSYDGTVYIFDLKNLIMSPVVLKEPSSWILSVAFSSDGNKLFLSTNKPDFLFSYPVKTNVLSDQLCSRSPKELTTEEWNTYIGSDIKYQKPCE